MSDCSAHRVPRAGLDPIDGPATALAVVRLAVHVPHVHETVVLLLDHDRCGLGITVVGGTCRPDDVLEVTECLLTAAAGTDRVGAIVVASVRPDDSASAACHPDGCKRGSDDVDDWIPAHWDPDRWVEMNELADTAGIELVEWFVISDHVTTPRDHFGEPPRW